MGKRSVLLGHLRRWDVKLDRTTVQTDNGSEYVGHMGKSSGKESLLPGRARTYQVYFNRYRKTLWKDGKTPATILAEAGSNVDPSALTLPLLRLETIPLAPLRRSRAGNDVPGLVKCPPFSP